MRTRSVVRLLDALPWLLFAVIVGAAAAGPGRLPTIDSAAQMAAQAAPTAIVASGMTFVLLVGGVDLSVGALMFVGAGLAGHLAVSGQPLAVCALTMIAVGMAGGLVNALLVTRLRLMAFVATLATLYIGRGTGRWITETRAINLPESFLALGSSAWLGVPVVAWIALAVAVAGQAVLSATPFGRQLYALGADPDAARKVGLDTRRLTTAVYVISGGCAGLAGVLALSRLGAVSPRFGELYEFDAITASVLGGASLYGGRGNVLGAAAGALLLRTIFSALVNLRADPYLYPLVTAAIIFAAVLIDTLRARLAARLDRRRIHADT